MNYFGGVLNNKRYWLEIGLAGGGSQSCGCKFTLATNLARARMVGSASGNYGRTMGKVKRARADETVLGNVRHQKQCQNEQQGVLNPGLRLPPDLTFLTEIYLALI
jgi:hypothetical protein